MKALLTLLIITSSFFTDSTSVIDSISTALRSGKTTVLYEYFATSVDVTILDYQNFLDKGATEQKVASFFTDKSVNGYEIIHKGSSKGKDSSYSIGKLKTDKGDFTVYLFITSQDDRYLIEEIKIEK